MKQSASLGTLGERNTEAAANWKPAGGAFGHTADHSGVGSIAGGSRLDAAVRDSSVDKAG